MRSSSMKKSDVLRNHTMNVGFTEEDKMIGVWLFWNRENRPFSQ